MIKRLPSLQILGLATGLVATALIAAVPSLDFAYRNGDVHVAIETAASGVALLVAFLLYGRLRQTGSRSDLARHRRVDQSLRQVAVARGGHPTRSQQRRQST